MRRWCDDAMMRWALLAVLLFAQPGRAQRWPGPADRYDDTFRKYSKRFFGPGFDWQYFKAQAMAESNLQPNAKSRVGARGLMQLMPSTYKEIKSASSLKMKAINDPE